MEPRIFVTSDTHFGHDREFLYGPRGFSSIKESDSEIIKRWNEVVGPNDIVYLLGDIMLNDNENGIGCLSCLNGNIKIILGNHDTDNRIKIYKELELHSNGRIEVLGFADIIKYKKYRFYLSHHPTFTSNLDDRDSIRSHLINLFGHTHQKTKFYQEIPFMYHVGLDAHNCYPVSLDQIIEDIKNEAQKCLDQL